MKFDFTKIGFKIKSIPINWYRWIKLKTYEIKRDKEPFLGTMFGFVSVATIIIFIWLLNFILMPILFKPPDGAGTAGDMFGGITALFSGLAFAGLITTLFMQRRELELQRGELKQTREVFYVQKFENTFFGLLGLLNNHIQSIEVSKHGVKSLILKDSAVKGRNALEIIAKNLPEENLETFKNEGKKWNPDIVSTGVINTNIQEITDAYNTIYSDYLESDLGPYFRLIYNILKLIENSVFDGNDEKKDADSKLMYSKLLRAHLNSSEVKILMFNCISKQGENLKPLVEKYGLLKHLTKEDRDKNLIVCKFYKRKAFR